MGYEVRSHRVGSDYDYEIVNVSPGAGDYATLAEARSAVREWVEVVHPGLRAGQWRSWLRKRKRNPMRRRRSRKNPIGLAIPIVLSVLAIGGVATALVIANRNKAALAEAKGAGASAGDAVAADILAGGDGGGDDVAGEDAGPVVGGGSFVDAAPNDGFEATGGGFASTAQDNFGGEDDFGGGGEFDA